MHRLSDAMTEHELLRVRLTYDESEARWVTGFWNMTDPRDAKLRVLAELDGEGVRSTIVKAYVPEMLVESASCLSRRYARTW